MSCSALPAATLPSRWWSFVCGTAGCPGTPLGARAPWVISTLSGTQTAPTDGARRGSRCKRRNPCRGRTSDRAEHGLFDRLLDCAGKCAQAPLDDGRNLADVADRFSLILENAGVPIDPVGQLFDFRLVAAGHVLQLAHLTCLGPDSVGDLRSSLRKAFD